MASRASGQWVNEMLEAYKNRHFVIKDGVYDLTTNVQFITALMAKQGFVQDGHEQDYKDLHVFPVEYFCPRQTTGEYLRTSHTYSDHLGIGSWTNQSGGWKAQLAKLIGQEGMTKMIKLKRKLFG